MAILGKPVSDCMFAVIKMELSGKLAYDPVLKTTQLSAHAQNHASPERCLSCPVLSADAGLLVLVMSGG